MHYAKPLARLVGELEKLPGIGPKSAQRLAFHILRSSEDEARRLAESITEVKSRIKLCPVCFNFTDKDVCDICRDPKRDRSLICVVAEPRDLVAMEKTNEFKGLYHVLGGVISPMDGIGPEMLKGWASAAPGQPGLQPGVRRLRTAAARPSVQLLPDPYVPIAGPTLEAEELGSHLPEQFVAGSSAIDQVTGQIPDPRTALVDPVDDPTVARVVALARRPVPDDLTSPKLRVAIVDFDRLAVCGELFAVNQIFCALGTTIKRAGSQDAFRRVDFEYPLAAAKLGVEHGARHFLLVSALGASAQSRIFYNRVKGQLEDALRTLPYRSVTIVRPSLLLGERREFRLGEVIARDRR
jgi:hypothetical protein